MKNILNSYAVKSFSEHPTAIWPLDDDAFYLSLMTDSDRQFSNYTLDNATAIEMNNPSFLYPEMLSPFDGDLYTSLEGTIPTLLTLTNASGNGTTVTYTTSSAHGLTNGQTVTILGVVPAVYAYSGVTVVSTPTSTTFTITANATGAYTSGGEVTYDLTMEAISATLFNNADLDMDKGSFSLNMYVHQGSVYVNWYEIGYVYSDGGDTEVVHRVYDNQNGSWLNFNFTFPIPSGNPTNFRLIFRVNVQTGGTNSDYLFTVNGMSLGQWSETTSSRSLGSIPVALPASCGISGYGVPADQYGILSNSAYYVTDSRGLLAKNDSSPMIFGTDSLTRVIDSLDGGPSIIFPADGMLNETGRYKKQTLEAWIRIRPNTVQPRRILGPLSGSYGVYVYNNHISLVVGSNVSSHYITGWYRPMLIHVIFNSDSAYLLVNGERVATVSVDRSTLSLPNSLADTNPDPDWWGVYSYSGVEKFDIDCISIYPYVMSESVAKKRFVWGQGTPSIPSINNQYLGTSTYIDYSNANYAVNVVYPDSSRWSSGYYNNLVASRTSLSTPSYSLPQIFLGGRDQDDWYASNEIINNTEFSKTGNAEKFVSFRPNTVTRTNLAPNPSMNTSGFYSATTTTLAYLTSGGYHGDNCLQVTHTSAGSTSSGVNLYANSAASTRIAVTEGQVYTISAYVKVPTGQSTTNLRFRRTFYTAVSGGSTVGSASTSPTTVVNVSDGWVRLSWTVTAPATSNAVVFRIEKSNSSSIGQIWLVDAILLEKASEANYYFDGSSQYGAWTGTADQSASTVTAWQSEGTNWNEIGYLYFNTLNVLQDPLSAIYGIFEVGENLAIERPLIFLKNVVTKDTFSIILSGMTVEYKFNNTILYRHTVSVNEHFAAGINIQAFAAYYGNSILDFFGSNSYIQTYVGGDGISTFEGKIYRVGFANQTNFQEIEENFLNNGAVVRSDQDVFYGHTASYTLVALYQYGRFALDISVSSRWEEYFPLTYFAKYVSDSEGNSYYDLDMLQLNIGYFHPYSIIGNEIDVSEATVKTYITFQSVVDGANDPIDAFTTTQKLPVNKVIDANQNSGYSAYTTKFEFVDGTVVIPPKALNINDIAMTVYFDIKQPSIVSNPIRIKNFEIASQVFSSSKFTQLGTRYGSYMYPYSKDGFYYSSKDPGPFSIYKRNTPYLYMTNDSGIRVINTSTDDYESAISLPINTNESPTTTIGALQMWLKHELDFSTSAQKLFEINAKTQTVEFMVVADASGDRGIIYARDKTTKSTVTNIRFFQNGVSVNNPIVLKSEWHCLGLSFDEVVDMQSYAGAINLFGGTTFNNISYYLALGLGRNENTVSRPWLKVLYDTAVYDNNSDPANESYFDAATGYIRWNYWYAVNLDNPGVNNKWSQVFLVNQDPSYVVTPEDIYAAFTGTNINIVDDDLGINIINDKVMSLSDITWSIITETPA